MNIAIFYLFCVVVMPWIIDKICEYEEGEKCH